MSQGSLHRLRRTALALAVTISTGIFAVTPVAAQSQQMEQRLTAIKDAQTANKQRLAQYIWTETEVIAINGEVKDTKTYQVQIVNGQQQKNLVNDQKADSSDGREGRLKERIIERKTEEYQEYGQSIAALAKQYTAPNPEALMQAKQAGNISLQPGSGTVNLVIKNYVKQGDSMTLTISEQNIHPWARR